LTGTGGAGQQPFVNVNVPQHPSFSPTSAFDSNGANNNCADGCSPVNYSPSSPPGYGSCGESGSSSSSGVNGAYHYPLSNNRKLYAVRAGGAAHERGGAGRENGYAAHHHRYDDAAAHVGVPCPCLTNPAAGHSFINLARQLEAVQGYLQQLPEHNQHTHCVVHRRIQELRAILHGEEPPKSTSSPFSGFDSHSEQLRSPADSDLMTPLSINSSVPALSAPATPHSLQTMHWDSQPNGGYNPYFTTNMSPVTDVYAKTVGAYDVVT